MSETPQLYQPDNGQSQLGAMRAQMLMQQLQLPQVTVQQPQQQPQQGGGAVFGMGGILSALGKAGYSALAPQIATGLNKMGAGNLAYSMMDTPQFNPGKYDGSQ